MLMNKVNQIKNVLKSSVSACPKTMAVFFKTGKGQYGEGDKFIGVTVPNLRKIAKFFDDLTLNELQKLLESKFNEQRLLALIILSNQYKKASKQEKIALYDFYLSNLQHVNNWNLVDASAHLIIGAHLVDKNRKTLLKLSRSKSLWERRIAIVSTWYFIRQNDLEWTFKLANLLKKDEHDLIHKAVGWMLREAGKRSEEQLIGFLEQHAVDMPRTMLRYAIEKFSKEERVYYLALKNKRS